MVQNNNNNNGMNRLLVTEIVEGKTLMCMGELCRQVPGPIFTRYGMFTDPST